MQKTIIIFIVLFMIVPSKAMSIRNDEISDVAAMASQIKPIKIKAKRSISAAASLKYPNKFACLSGGLEFTLADLDDKLQVSFNVIQEDIPGSAYSGVFGADETGKFMWCKSGWREAIIIDTESKKVIQKMASYSGNTFISAFVPVVGKDNFVYVSVVDAGERPSKFSVFDFTQESPVANIAKLYYSLILIRKSDSCLIVSYDENNQKIWINATLSKTDISFLPDDNLTKELTKNQIQYRAHQRAYNFGRNIIIGDIKSEPFSIRWNSDKTDIKIEPIILQRPKPDMFLESWEFSLDGDWCMNKCIRNWNTEKEYISIVFYKVDNAFPNGLSMPIYGGLTSEDNKGCFINHDALGPLYLDIPPSGDPVIYKLNQIPELLKGMKQ
jgi:hypothetical protein